MLRTGETTMMRTRTASSPPPLWGRDREGGMAEHQPLWFPPPLTPPRVVSKTRLRPDGEGNPGGVCREGGAPSVGWVKRSADPTQQRWVRADVGSSLPLDPTYTLVDWFRSCTWRLAGGFVGWVSASARNPTRHRCPCWVTAFGLTQPTTPVPISHFGETFGAALEGRDIGGYPGTRRAAKALETQATQRQRVLWRPPSVFGRWSGCPNQPHRPLARVGDATGVGITHSKGTESIPGISGAGAA
jgi:hypothetical protein